MLLALVAVILLVRASVFTVSEGQLAIKSIGGEIVDSNFQPGLHFRIPLVNEVTRFDGRILTQMYLSEHFLTREQEQLNVDFYVKWRINNLRRYYESTGGSEDVANARLGETIRDSIKTVVTQRTLQQVVTAERAEFTDAMMKTARPFARAARRRTGRRAHHQDRFAAAGPGFGVRAHARDLQGAGREAARRGRRGLGPHPRGSEQGADGDPGRRVAPGERDPRSGRCLGERGVREVVLEECGVL